MERVSVTYGGIEYAADWDVNLVWYRYATLEERRQAILNTPVIHKPGSTYLYSDLSGSYFDGHNYKE